MWVRLCLLVNGVNGVRTGRIASPPELSLSLFPPPRLVCGVHAPPQLYAPMPIMIWIAIIIEAAIENWADMGILLGIQFINATLGWWVRLVGAARGSFTSN